MIPAGLAVAQFVRCYPGFFQGCGWSTQDGVIPWRLFWLFYTEIPRIHAAEKLEIAQAIAHGIGMVMGGESSSKTTVDVFKIAYPWIPVNE